MFKTQVQRLSWPLVRLTMNLILLMGFLINIYMPMNRIWEWAVENNDNGEVNALVLPQKKDIWLLGVMALELLYGQLLVLSHNDFMLIIDYVNRHPGLPRNWTQLRHNALYNPGNMISSPAVSPLYVCFVKSCFAAFQIRP